MTDNERMRIMELNKKTVKKILGIIAFTVILCAVLINFDEALDWLGFFWGVITPFAVGGALAFCLNIPMSFFERKIFRITPENAKKESKILRVLARPLSLVLTLLCVVLIIAIVAMVIAPQLRTTIISVGDAMAAWLPRAQEWVDKMFADDSAIMVYINSLELDWSKWLESLKDFAVNGAGSILSYTMSATRIVVNSVVTAFISIIFSFYVLMQKENLSRQLTRLIRALFKEKTVDKILHVCQLSYFTFSRFITGQCIEALILGFLFFIFMTIFRFPYALLVGVVISVTALIPIVGAFIGCFIGAFLILMVNPMQALAFVIMFLVLQQIEGNLIYPHVVGTSVGLPSMWVLFAVTVGGSLMGVGGMLIFIPIFSVIYSLLREWVGVRLKARKPEVPAVEKPEEPKEP